MENLEEVWSQALQQLAARLPRPGYAWLREARPVAFHGSTLIIGLPHQFAREIIEGRFAGQLHAVLSELIGRPIQIEFAIPPQEEQEEAWEEVEAVAAREDPDPPGRTPEGSERRLEREPGGPLHSHPLNPRYVFSTFVIGSSNRLAHAASLAVAEAPARAYNPLFIYGGVGLGKTHLMQAIAHKVLEKNRQTRVVYISTETFANEMINAIRDRRTVDFRNRYRNVDVLLVDDIQFLAGKESTQEEFFHTFNALHEANRQIVLSSDRPPKEIPTLEERLRSRFEWGLISDIQPPDLETRIAILRQKAQAERLAIPDEVLTYVAERIATNIRELEGALIRLVAYSSLTHREIDLDLADEALRDIMPQNQPKQITIRFIQETVASFYQLDLRDFKIRKRTRSIAFPRQVAMYLARELTDFSLPKIGEEFGGRDHTTVIHAHEKIARELERDAELSKTVALLRRRILG